MLEARLKFVQIYANIRRIWRYWSGCDIWKTFPTEFCFSKHVAYPTFFGSVEWCYEIHKNNVSQSFMLASIVAKKTENFDDTWPQISAVTKSFIVQNLMLPKTPSQNYSPVLRLWAKNWNYGEIR